MFMFKCARRAPSIWGQCGDLHLDASFSMGSAGRSGTKPTLAKSTDGS